MATIRSVFRWALKWWQTVTAVPPDIDYPTSVAVAAHKTSVTVAAHKTSVTVAAHKTSAEVDY